MVGIGYLSFISLNKVLEPLWDLLIDPKEIILLIKPQFEVGRSRVGKKGVVRNSIDRSQAIFEVLETARKLGWQDRGLTFSPVRGPAGNIEYLLWLNRFKLETESSLSFEAIAKISQEADDFFINSSGNLERST